MFKRTHLASAVLLAMSCQLSFAQETDTQNQDSDGNTVEVIEVSGIRGSLNKAINIKRQEKQIVDAIVAEDIGKFPDNNVVEALQRVTGVQTTDRGAGEVTGVTIRGLSDVTTTVNGRNVFTADGRAVALQDIPAALLESVNVYKTRSAAQIGSGIAGQIDVQTQRPFNFEDKAFVLAGRMINQDQADKTDPQISMLVSDRWDVGGDGEFGALLNVAYTRTNYRDQTLTAGAMVPFMTETPAAGFTPLQRIFPDQCDGGCWVPGMEEGLPFAAGSTLNINGVDTPYYLSRDAIFGFDNRGERERPAVNLSLQYAPNADSEYTFEAFYNGYRTQNFNTLNFYFVDWWGSVDPADPVTTIDGTNIIQSRYVNDAFNFNSADYFEASTDSYLYSLSGKWQLTDNLSLKSDLYYQDSEYKTDFLALRNTAVHPRLYMDVNPKGDGIPSVELIGTDAADPSIYTVAEMFENGSDAKGDALTFSLDGEYLLDSGFFTNVRFGVYLDDRNATAGNRDTNGFLGAPMTDFDESYYRTNSGFYDGNATFPSSWVVMDAEKAFGERDVWRDRYGSGEGQPFAPDRTTIFYNFDIEEKTTSLYVETDFETRVGGRTLDGEFGLRYERSSADMKFFDKVLDTSSASRSDSTVLPSLMLRYHLTDDLLARFSYTETIRRPGFGQLNSYIQYNPDVTDIGYGTASGGNPNLKPVESKNYDFSLEYYFGAGNTIYGTYFERDIQGFVYDSVRSVQYQGPNDDEPYTYILSLPDNTSNGKLTGLELGLVYFPEDLPGYLDGLGVQASYTALDSSQDIPIFDRTTGELERYISQPFFGVSDSSYSAVLIYDHDDFDMRLSYVWREDFLRRYEARLFANPLPIYQEPEKSLDFQLSYDVTDNLTVTFDATNITEEIFSEYYQYQDTHNFYNGLYSRTFALGVRYKM